MSLLDPFAGTGALSFEAISRGADKALAIDSDRPAQRVIERNIKALGLDEQVQLAKATANAWLQANHDQTFDLILCDPPYDNLQPHLLERLAERAKGGGVVVLSLPPNSDVSLPVEEYQLLAQKSYGDARLLFYRRGRE
jgi:16S rRNA (guanine966-N2)-methyltransferase